MAVTAAAGVFRSWAAVGGMGPVLVVMDFPGVHGHPQPDLFWLRMRAVVSAQRRH